MPVSFEHNDTITTATATGITPTHLTFTSAENIGDNSTVLPELDVDFFKVNLSAGDRIKIDIDANDQGSFLDSVLRLFDSSGNELALNDNAPAPGESFSLDSFLDFTASASGDYYVGVSSYFNFSYNPFVQGSGFNDNFFGSTGNYSLDIALVQPTTFTGTANDDFLRGTDNVDIISGLAGDDTLLGLGDNDQIYGGSGDDLILSGGGDDTVDAGTGDDQIFGGDGSDIIKGGDGIDVIFGDNNNGFGDFFSSNDQLFGGKGNDRIFGEVGDDQINGEDGNDNLDGGDGFDIISGGKGKDRIFGGFGDDQLSGEVGDDQINGDSGFDFLSGGDGNDFLFGGTEGDTLSGDAGTDLLQGGEGFDFLDGGSGNDRLIGVDLKVPQFGGIGFGAFETDTLTGGTGSDTFVLGDATRIYYDDGNSATAGDFDYAQITDFNVSQDFIQLKGSADLYSLDFFTDSLGTLSAALIYDPGITARGETIGILQGVSTSLSVTNSAFKFV